MLGETTWLVNLAIAGVCATIYWMLGTKEQSVARSLLSIVAMAATMFFAITGAIELFIWGFFADGVFLIAPADAPRIAQAVRFLILWGVLPLFLVLGSAMASQKLYSINRFTVPKRHGLKVVGPVQVFGVMVVVGTAFLFATWLANLLNDEFSPSSFYALWFGNRLAGELALLSSPFEMVAVVASGIVWLGIFAAVHGCARLERRNPSQPAGPLGDQLRQALQGIRSPKG